MRKVYILERRVACEYPKNPTKFAGENLILPKTYRMYIRLFWLFACLFVGLNVQAQHPNTNIYLFGMEFDNTGSPRLTEPQFLTEFNRHGYNNQPYFFTNDELYISVKTLDDTTQTEIYSLNLDKKLRTRITQTAESEYSPTLMPNYYFFSAVRVEMDEDRTQRLWQFPIDRMGNGKPVFPTIRNIGYHYWVNSRNVLLYIVNQPNLLVIANTQDQSYNQITSNVGRCFKRLPNGNIAFVKKETDDKWQLCELNLRTFQFSPIVSTLQGSEDFALLQDGSFIMGRGSKLYRYNRKDENPDWEEFADLRYYDISSISRLAVSGDGKIAVVAE